MAKVGRPPKNPKKEAEPRNTAKVGRPPKDISPERIKALMRLNPTLEDTAAFFECDARTIHNYLRTNFDCNFFEFRNQNMVHTRLELIRSALKKSERSDTMHIFCLKNLCKWKDKHEEDVPAGYGKVIVMLPSNGREVKAG